MAGVSAATVSRALARPDMVASSTRGKILEAVRITGYRPNELARSLRQQETRTIGLVVTDLNPFHATLVKGVQDAAEQHDLNVILCTSDDNETRERNALETLRSHVPQGIILIPTAYTQNNYSLIQGIPVVELDRVSGLPEVHTVQVDNRYGAYQAVKHLIRLGHRRIAGIFASMSISTAKGRFLGYQDALQEAGIALDERIIRYGDNLERSGREATLSLFDTANKPTALFISNHEMTVGALLSLRQLGLRFPEDVSLTCFDDSRLMLLHEPPITVVAQPTYQLGVTAFQTLWQSLKNPTTPLHVELKTTFIERASTAAPQWQGELAM